VHGGETKCMAKAATGWELYYLGKFKRFYPLHAEHSQKVIWKSPFGQLSLAIPRRG